MVLLGPGELFGEDDIIYDRDRYFTWTWISPSGDVLVMRREDFQKYINNTDTREKLKGNLELINSHREKRVEKVKEC